MNQEHNDFSEMLNRVMQNPDALSGLMKIADNLKISNDNSSSPSSDDTHSLTGRTAGDGSHDAESRLDMDGISAGQKENRDDRDDADGRDKDQKSAQKSTSHTPGDEERIRLMTALRPYLSDSRQKKVDSVLGVLRLLRAAEASGLLQGGLNLSGLFSGSANQG